MSKVRAIWLYRFVPAERWFLRISVPALIGAVLHDCGVF